jgi:hypothetical protein
VTVDVRLPFPAVNHAVHRRCQRCLEADGHVALAVFGGLVLDVTFTGFERPGEVLGGDPAPSAGDPAGQCTVIPEPSMMKRSNASTD